jgi:cellulose synthase/poly-beta-1,6-N-acetylglucosamine synthase-like glycosyltransferase/peptidoglycan/xylan/chitin deacetylase (PgdA/CDA1 family)/spore germination protein YaaH
MHAPAPASVFLDATGKRWRRIRRATLAAGIVSTLLALGLAVTLISPQALPNLQEARRAVGVQRRRTIVSTRQAAEKAAAKIRLMAALARKPAPPAVRTSQLRVEKNRAEEPAALARASPLNEERPKIVAGFVVKWDDNSFASFKAHATDLDWVVGEWAFLTAGGSSLTIGPDFKVLYVVQQLPAKNRPRVFAMVSNFDHKRAKFNADGLRRLLGTRASRQAAAIQLVDAAQKYGLAGITMDFEEVPGDLLDPMFEFMRFLRAGLTPGGRLLTSAVAVSTDSALARRYAAANDYLFLMLYDEHYSSGDPGPVASQAWYDARARQLLQAVSPARAILALGAYGYHWDDAGGRLSGRQLTFQDAIRLAQDNGALVQFDSVSLNPYLTWTDTDSTDHAVWFLDGATAWNQSRVAVGLGTAGAAIWRLGSEDPSLWNAISNRVEHPEPTLLERMPPGYDPQFDGKGEMLRLTSRPSPGRRFLRADPRTGAIVHERITQYPSPWIVQRFGARDSMKVALTFDDGPDPRYTPAILDTLRSRGVKATFFVIGRNADENPGLLRRIVREGHEIGNHTYTHPNLSLTNPLVARLELIATGRLLETLLDRRTALFRPPYFGDAEPTTSDELDPIGIATDLGYLTVGVHIDSEDWRLTEPDSILRRTLQIRGDSRDSNHVVLLHDSGGDRRATVAVLGALIDSLRAGGDSLVLASELAGISRDEAMPRVASRTALSRVVDIVGFGAIGALDWGLYWIFLVAVALGMVRLAFIITLAAMQRARSRKERSLAGAAAFAPGVSVVIPAFCEERVVVPTIERLLAQDYAGHIEIIAVDDGSPDATYDVAARAFGAHPRVRVLRQPNGGKAAALNFGIAHAREPVVVCLDADTQFERGTVRELVAPLADPGVGAVAGNAKVGNRINLVIRWQALEYVTSQNLERRAFALLDCITVIPGAVGAWRRALVLDAGGFSGDTLAEDQDLTIRLRRLGHRVAYAQRAVAWTEAPDTLGALSKQRFRWSFGTLQCAWKHRDALFRTRYGTLGLVALPNTWVFQLLLTALSPLTDLMFAWALLNVWLTLGSHGASYALTDLEHVMMYYGVFLITDWLGAMIAFMSEPDEERGLTWLIMLQRFAYRQIMYFVVLKSFLAAVRGRVVGWGQLEPKATVGLPA